MQIEIKIPRLGWSMEEGIFNGWLKKDGDAIKTGEPLFTLESEKSSQDIESADSGTLHIPKDSPQAGDTVKVGQVIGQLVAGHTATVPDEKPEKQPPAQTENSGDGLSKVDSQISSPVPAPSRIKIEGTGNLPVSSPRARRRAAELGVEVSRLQGSGNHGRIIEADVFKAAGDRGNSPGAMPKSKVVSAIIGPVSTMRRKIADRTVLSFSQIPHFYVRAEVDVTELIKMREHLVGILEKECGVRITLTDFLLRAQALALRDFPAANAVWQNNGIINYSDADLGVVVGLPDGLVIPVMRAAQKLSLVQLARERTKLVEAGRQGRFNADMLTGGASSISNLGTTRTDEFSAIIAPEQSSILAVGRAAPRPYVVEGRLEIRTTLRLCLSVDHRVLDGGPAAEFLGLIVKNLENSKLLADAA